MAEFCFFYLFGACPGAVSPFVVVANVNGSSEIQEIFATFSARRVCVVVVILCVFYRFLWFVPDFFLYLFSFTINCKIVARGFYSELFSVHSAHRFVVRFLISNFIIHYSMDVCVCVWWGKFIEPQKAATNYETQNSVNCQMFDGSGYLWLTDRERNIHTYLRTHPCTDVHR